MKLQSTTENEVDSNREQYKAEYESWFLSEVEKGIQAADQGMFASLEEVEQVLAKWGVQVESLLITNGNQAIRKCYDPSCCKGGNSGIMLHR